MCKAILFSSPRIASSCFYSITSLTVHVDFSYMHLDGHLFDARSLAERNRASHSHVTPQLGEAILAGDSGEVRMVAPSKVPSTN